METHITVNRNQSATLKAHLSTAEEPHFDERRAAVNRLIIAAHSGYNSPPPQGESMAVAVEVWKDALDESEVPTSELRAMLKKVLSGRGSNYPPGVSEICEAWRKHLISLPRQTIQEADAVKARALPQGHNPLAERGRALHGQMSARMAAGKGNVQCECGWPCKMSHDLFDWVCAAKEDCCSFRWPVSDTFNAPIGKGKAGPMGGDFTPTPTHEAEIIPREYSDDELISALKTRCNLDLSKIDPQRAADFAREMLEIVTPDLWTVGLAKAQWAKQKVAA